MPTYTGISSEAFRHPLDRQAEQALRNIPGFDLVARKFLEFTYDRPQFIYHLGNDIQVGPRQFSSVYQIYREVLHDLDIYPEPALFVSQNPLVNAYALGQEVPCVVLNTELLNLLNEVELRAVIAHELGHLKCGHTTLTQMALWLRNALTGLATSTFGLSALVGSGLMMAFYEWSRKAELSADRAALLVMDDLTPVFQNMMRLAGGSSRYAHEMSLPEFLRQAERYQNLDQDGLNQVYKFLLYNNLAQGTFLTHPFTVERVQFLQEWSTSTEYQQIRQGNYPRAGATGSVEVPVQPPTPAEETEADRLRREIAELQQEIDRIKRSDSGQS